MTSVAISYYPIKVDIVISFLSPARTPTTRPRDIERRYVIDFSSKCPVIKETQ